MVNEGVAWFGTFSQLAIQRHRPTPYNSQFVSQSVTDQPPPPADDGGLGDDEEHRHQRLDCRAGLQARLAEPRKTTHLGAGRGDLAAGDSIGQKHREVLHFHILPTTPGPYNFKWRMFAGGVNLAGRLHNQRGDPVRAPAVTCAPASLSHAERTTDLGPALKTCINGQRLRAHAQPAPGHLWHPGTQVLIDKPLTLQTQGLSGSTANCDGRGKAAVLKAPPLLQRNVVASCAARIDPRRDPRIT